MINNPTFDALSYSNDTVTLYQATISTQHTVEASGLDGIWAKLSTHFPAIRAYNSGLKWRLVFIVPEDVAPEWKWAQPITNTITRKWKSLEQYVVPFPVLKVSSV